MTSQLRPIVALLDQQTELAKSLVEQLQQDHQLIIAHDTEALEQSNRRKEELVVRLHAAERQRQEHCLLLARELGISAEEAVVSRLSQHLGRDGTLLIEAADRLRAVVTSLRELVAVSHGFLEQSIVGIRGLISLIATFRAREQGTYDASGRLAAGTTNEAVALRQEV